MKQIVLTMTLIVMSSFSYSEDIELYISVYEGWAYKQTFHKLPQRGDSGAILRFSP